MTNLRRAIHDDDIEAPPPSSRVTRARVPVLLIEEDEHDAKLVARELRKLESLKFDIVRASTLGEATEWLSRHACQVVIVDLNLSDAQGLAALIEVRRVCPLVPVIVLSAFVDESLRITSIGLGAEDVISKREFDTQRLLLCILSMIERNRVREHERRVAEIIGAMKDADVVADRGDAAESARDQVVVFDGASLEERLLTSERLASLGTIAASVAHEINNPLGAVLVNVELAMRDASGAVLNELEDARRATLRIRQIVRDLRIFSRREEEVCVPLDVHSTLDSVVRMASNEIRHRAKMVTDYDCARAIRANEGRLSQVFLNLLVNAAQSISEGNVDKNEIRVTTRLAADGRLVIQIKDTGCGIPGEAQRRLFTPFFTTKPAGSGTGLGLAIVQRIVASLEGEISFESEVGKGTCFTLRFPTVGPIDPPKSAHLRVVVPKASRRGRVLVVDDDPLILHSMKWTLEGEHEVICFDGAAVALDVIALGERFDVVLCDLLMPEMTGVEFYRAIEAADPAQASKFVFMTGGALTRRAREFLQRSPHPYFEKPVEVQELRALVNERMAAREGGEEKDPGDEIFHRTARLRRRSMRAVP